LTKKNNGPDTDLTWNIDRGKPGPNKRLDKNGYVTNAVQSNDDSKSGNSSRKSRYDPDDFDYVSDLNWDSSSNGLGPVERDQSNGGDAEDDGGAIIVGGRKYSSGLGVANRSEVVLDLDGKYSRFFSDIGINDSIGAGGSMVFKVYADGKKVFDSGEINGSSALKGVTVKTSGVRELRLVTSSVGDGPKDSDHGVWAAARLLPVGKGPVELGSGA